MGPGKEGDIDVDVEGEEPFKEQALSDDEIKLIGELGSDFDDPDELWKERTNYWAGDARRDSSNKDSLRLRLNQLWGRLWMPGRRSRLDAMTIYSDADWAQLGDTVLCPASPARPPHAEASKQTHAPLLEAAGSGQVAVLPAEGSDAAAAIQPPKVSRVAESHADAAPEPAVDESGKPALFDER